MGGQRYQESLLGALFKEHMENGKDIADISVLSDIAEDVGMMTKDDVSISSYPYSASLRHISPAGVISRR